MRLQMGSLHNCLLDNSPTKTVSVGDGASIIMHSDRHACTVTGVRKTRTGKLVVTVQWDKATRIDHNGMSESQEYSFEQWTDGPIETFYQAKDGVLRTRPSGRTLIVGSRLEYYDYSL